MAGRIRIRLKAFDHWVVDQTASDICRTAEKTGATVKGPFPFRPNVSGGPCCGRRTSTRRAESSSNSGPTSGSSTSWTAGRRRWTRSRSSIFPPAWTWKSRSTDEPPRADRQVVRADRGRRNRGISTMAGLIGRKIGMTRVFDDEGTAVPVTVVEAGPCPVVQVKTEERDGYRAIQLGFGTKKEKRPPARRSATPPRSASRRPRTCSASSGSSGRGVRGGPGAHR
jgi:hypothetical protein